MENKVYVTVGTIISPLGIGVEEHLNSLKLGRSGISCQPKSGFNGEDWYLAKMDDVEAATNRFDVILNIALDQLKLAASEDVLSAPSTLFILSSTKGNIDLLPSDVFASARTIVKESIKAKNELLIISNACISGVLAVNTAADYIKSNLYKDVFVIGIDVLSDFVVYGFQSLFAMSDQPCRPFDKERKGVSLGEACGILHLSTRMGDDFCVEYLAGASSNDANHISGPSRTGEGLFRAIQKTLERSELQVADIDFISAHGTATNYNDEMESIAFSRCKMNEIPLNSFKGYFGHTLGAAGVVEILVSILCLREQILFKNLGFEVQGTSEKLNIITNTEGQALKTILKTASGFGGGNAAVAIKVVE